MNEKQKKISLEKTLAQLIFDENTPAACERRALRRLPYVLEKHEEARRLEKEPQQQQQQQRGGLPSVPQRSSSSPSSSSSYGGQRTPFSFSAEDRLLLGYYEAICAEQIKKRKAISFTAGKVDTAVGPPASPAVVDELTKWVKIALSRKKMMCQLCSARTLPQRCSAECQFFYTRAGCRAGELCHSRHCTPLDSAEDDDKPPLFLNQ